MPRSPSAERGLAPAEATTLLDLADASIVRGLRGGGHVAPPDEIVQGPLAAVVGAFVTITVRGALNGCIGNVEGIEPLAEAVPRLAWSAAFADPRLPRLTPTDYGHAAIEISVLSTLTPVDADSRHALLGGLRAGVDGLLVAAGARQGVFLPAVWEQLPDPDDFLDHLWRKAGLAPGRWPDRLEAWRFTVEKFARAAGAGPHDRAVRPG